MPDVQYPDGLACLVHFIENAIDVLALTEKKTSDFPSRFLRFTSERTSIGSSSSEYRQSISSSNHSGPLVGVRSVTQA